MAEFIIEAINLNYKYPDGTMALNNLSMSIEKGKKIAILGSNGAGKTTLFLHFNGILKPSGGQIRFDGKDVKHNRKCIEELRRNVGIVFQDPDAQLFSASVIQEISFGPINMGLSRDEVLARVNQAMKDTEIDQLGGRPTHFLSYGQKKRVSIADILAMDPEVIIFDEPTACLDPRLSVHVAGLLDRLSKKGKTVMLSTHDVDLAYTWADYIFVINGGAVSGQGKPEDIFRDREFLAGNSLVRPWIIDVFDELVNKGLVFGDLPAPRTREDLLSCIPAGERKSRTVLKIIK
ncbi:MAG: cobalt ABC transporter ATPase [Peptococcaceae bacterium BICA1-7]|nr:MAG: cobalt ABC transporter ATPase [Peptococcaceae bacterium BICA1-7]HBV96674.1 energy-coupling factor ABC transporter ATP-binding protein [Desulfotomaculum sp.]